MKLIYSLIIALVITVGALTLEENFSDELQNSILRLHIVADNDTDEAQKIKLKVRDAVIKNVSFEDGDFIQKAELEARKVLAQNDADYDVKGSVGRFYFPKKKYENIILPEGEYYGVRLVLGNGAGENWWCIMYPPICANDEIESLKEQLSPDNYELITEDNDKVKIKFKTVEMVKALRSYMKQ